MTKAISLYRRLSYPSSSMRRSFSRRPTITRPGALARNRRMPMYASASKPSAR